MAKDDTVIMEDSRIERMHTDPPPDMSAHDLVVSISGGKDSNASALHLRDLGLPFSMVHMTTGWEDPRHHDYMARLEGFFRQDIVRLTAPTKPLPPAVELVALSFEERLGGHSPMVRMILGYALFPSRRGRWCTRRLKMEPICEYLADFSNPVNVVGIRAQESQSRAKEVEWEWSDGLDAHTWRPIIRWTFEDVVAIHARHGLEPNPLYLDGAERVGCWPCIMTNKAEMAHLVTSDPGRIDLIEDLEAAVNKLRQERGKEGVGTWFTERKESKPFQIRDVAAWAMTSHGGYQLNMFAAGPRDKGCMRWGLCDTGARQEAQRHGKG